MKIAVLHRYPPKQVVGTNASFIEFLSKLSTNNHQAYYLTFKDHGLKPKIKNLKYIYLPFYFERGNNSDKILKTILWILLSPLYVSIINIKHKLDLIYCDDSVPYFAFISKLLNPCTKVVMRLGDLHSGYALADSHRSIFKFVLYFEVLMWRTMDGVITISESFKEFVVLQGLPRNKVKVVEESVNLSSNRISVTNKAEKTIFFHGSLVKCKGLDCLLDAFSMVQSKRKDLHLLVAGGGDEEHKLKKYVKSKHILNVSFSGWYDHAKLDKLMKKVSIGIVMRSPNIANNFVVTTCLLENWKYNKPVIAPNLTSFRTIIKDWHNGVLFDAGDSVDLANKIEALLDKKSVWPQLGKNGNETARRMFDHKIIAAKLVHQLEDYV